MPLPPRPLTIEGGCNCKAIRYRINIPAIDERPFYPAGGAAADVRMPVVCTDHCNDCRSATGSVLPSWILTPIDMVSTSCLDAASLPKDGKLDPAAARAWRPAADIFLTDSAESNTTLSCFASSKNRRRSFCARCGTMLAYQVFPLPPYWSSSWPVMLDIVLGTVDRTYLDDGEILAPERQLWWECGVDWVRQLASHGAGHLPVHPQYRVDNLTSI